MPLPSDTARPAEPRAEPASGFTLIELLVVLAIMGLLLIVIPQATAGLPRFQLHAAAVRLGDTLRQLRDDAIRTGEPTALMLDATHARYQATGISGWQALPGVVDGIKLSRDTPVAASDDTLRFFADGSASGGVITLRHASRTEAITIEWLTGRVRND